MERCKILCKNKKCIYWSGIKKEYFKPTRNYVGFEDDYYTGICNKPTIRLKTVWHETRNYLLKFVSCCEGTQVTYNIEPCIECTDGDCMWNFGDYCGKEEGIAIDFVAYGKDNDMELSCRAQSNKKIRGHIDFFRFVGQGAGSHLDDPPGYADNFWEKKRDKIKELKKQGVPEEDLNTIYGREVH